MNDLTREPGVPFPLSGNGPEVPFPLKEVEEVMCRDCPFPMHPAWPEDVRKAFDDWQKLVLGKLETKKLKIDPLAAEKPYAELIGKQLVVLRPGQPGGQLIYAPNRLTIRVDAADHIESVSPGANIHPAGGDE